MTRDEIVRTDQSDGGMFAVIPSVVMADSDLPQSARMLYGVITWKCNKTAYCWASNRTLGEIIGLSAKRISVLLSALEEKGHIEMEVIRDQVTGQVLKRYIYPIVKSSREQRHRSETTAHPPPENKDTPPNSQGDPTLISGGGIPEIGKEKHKEETKSNPPYSPPKGGRRVHSAPRAAPDWCPDRFDGLWKYYPKQGRKDKQRAMDEWDKLRPDAALIDTIALALQTLNKHDEQWRRGIGIPYLHRFLRDRRWEDAEETSRPETGQQSDGWADDPEVI